MPKVRAKFWVQTVALGVGQTQVTLSAVCRGADNKEWAAYTPSGTISMTILNDLAAEHFKPGDEWFVDFTSAPKSQEGMQV